MKKITFTDIFLILLLLIFGCKEEGNSPTENNNLCTITGKVTDISSGVGISGVTIQTNPATTTSATNQSGDYTISDVTPGNYLLTASKTGYNTFSAIVNTLAGSTTTTNILLATTIPAPNSPVLSSPLNRSVNISIAPVLKWNSSQNAESYNMELSTTSSFSNIVLSLSHLTITNHYITSLEYSTTYYWRVQAVNGSGISAWSDFWSFSTAQFSCGQTLTYSGKVYNTVQIGTQCWFKENLDVGTMILEGVPIPSDNGIIEKYCYDDQPANCSTYGGLYLWNEAMNYSMEPGVKGICPAGWHIPTKEEFDILIETVGGDGNSLKTEGIGKENGIGTNTSGFSALLAGHGHISNTYMELEHYSIICSSSIYLLPNVNFLLLYDDISYVEVFRTQRNFAFSVRCLKN